MKLPDTAHKVAFHTSEKANLEIREKTLRHIRRAESSGDLGGALRRLDREWDTERVLETNAAALLLVSLGLGALRDRRWLWLTGGVAAFLLHHALRGWCPPLPVIRALGVRTAGEIGAERMALKVIRGDFTDVIDPETALRASE